MIALKDLRSGNIVRATDGRVAQVVWAKYRKVYLKYMGDILKATEDTNEISPLAVDAWWLEYMGFSRMGAVWRLAYGEKGLRVELRGDEVNGVMAYGMDREGSLVASSVVVHSVHEIQNLWRAVSGEEITFKETIDAKD